MGSQNFTQGELESHFAKQLQPTSLRGSTVLFTKDVGAGLLSNLSTTHYLHLHVHVHVHVHVTCYMLHVHIVLCDLKKKIPLDSRRTYLL